MDKKFYLMREHGKLMGVASGIAYYFGIKTWIVRAVFVLLALLSFGVPTLAYVLIGLFAPKNISDPLDYEEVCQ